MQKATGMVRSVAAKRLPGLQYRPDVDGLRAIAVLAVVGYHAFPDRVRGGFVGVDVFFVISGYLISSILLLDLHAGKFSFRHFYARRIRRIFPALLLVLAACFGFGWLTLLPREYEQLGKHIAAGAGFISNFAFWRESGYFDKAAELKPLLHLWSLGIEEQFYLLWPLLLYITWKLRLKFPLLILPVLLVSFGLNVGTVQSDKVAAFYSPLTRFWELMIGSMFAYVSLFPMNPSGALPAGKRKAAALFARLAVSRELQALAGILFIVASVFALNRDRNFPGWWAALPAVGAVLLLSAGPEAWINRRVLSNRALVLVGLVSYPFYLWHWPLLSFARIVGDAAPGVGTRMVAIVASLIAAWITCKVVEIPIRRGTYGSVKVACLATLMLVMGGIGYETWQRRGLEFRIRARAPELLQEYARLRNYDLWTEGRYHSCWLTMQQPADKYSEVCADLGKPGPLVFVWGDSHAARLFVGLKKTIGDQVRLAEYARDACPPIVDFGYPNCANGNRFVLDKLQKARPDTVILFAVWNHYMQRWKQDLAPYKQLDQTISEIEKLGTRQVVVVGAPPQWRKDLPRTLVEFYSQDVPLHRVPRRMDFGLDLEARRSAESLESLLRLRKDVTYISAWDAFCDKDGCLTRVDDEADGITTVDYGHFTDKTAEYFANRLPLVAIKSAR